ncbi:MAG: peptide ABC transporter substrate-binding protein [Anaerolineae bacterium]|nr:peptide ABC transporter substrate-binding protein [Anaerolineae bacterium]
MTGSRPLRHKLLHLACVVLIVTAGFAAGGCQPQPTLAPTPTRTAMPPDEQAAETEAAETQEPEVVEEGEQEDPTIISIDLGTPPETIDPAKVAPLNGAENDLVDNLFAGLFRINPQTNQLEPGLAESWEKTEDGLTWWIRLRQDIYWVKINPQTEQIEPVRSINAEDVVYSVRRICHPSTGTPLGYQPGMFLIEGCEAINAMRNPLPTDEDIEQTLGVKVIDDYIVEFTLTEDSAVFPSILAMSMFHPVPADLVDVEGDAWTNPETIWTSGPYTLQPTIPAEEGYTLIANPHWPIERTGNIDIILIGFDNTGEAYQAWKEGSLELVTVPADQLANTPFRNDPAYRMLALPGTSFIVFSYESYPVNDPLVRRALSLSIDREAFVYETLAMTRQAGLPAASLVPPGSVLAPPFDEKATGYDPDAARAALEEAGYPGCYSFPRSYFYTDDTDNALEIANTYIAMWEKELGCTGRFIVRRKPLRELYDLLQTPQTMVVDNEETQRPIMITLAWEADYPDTQHWLADILGCQELFPDAYLDQLRTCGTFDRQLEQAPGEFDDETRAETYASILDGLFSDTGEMPVIPLYYYARPLAISDRLDITDTHAGPLHFDRWVLESE